MADVTFDEVEVGPASAFKDTINNNFKKAKTGLDSVNNKIVVSDTTPADQAIGDVWISPV